MKLLLTSAGLSNKTIANVLIKLVGKSKNEISVAFIPTAAENLNEEWLNKDLDNIIKCQVKSLKVVDISVLQKEDWIKVFEMSDVLFFGGGDTFRLMYWIDKSGLRELLSDLLKSKVYVGISAGSCVTGPRVDMDFFTRIFPDEKNEQNVVDGLNLVPFYIMPHLNSNYSKRLKEKNVRSVLGKTKEKVYVIDDQCAVEVNNGKVNVIGGGKHFEIN